MLLIYVYIYEKSETFTSLTSQIITMKKLYIYIYIQKLPAF